MHVQRIGIWLLCWRQQWGWRPGLGGGDTQVGRDQGCVRVPADRRRPGRSLRTEPRLFSCASRVSTRDQLGQSSRDRTNANTHISYQLHRAELVNNPLRIRCLYQSPIFGITFSNCTSRCQKL